MSDTQNATPAEMLERHITDPCIPKSEAEWWAHREIERLRAEVEKLARERDEARAALQPFAAEAQRYDPDDGDDLHPAWNSRFEIKHLRAARKALQAKP